MINAEIYGGCVPWWSGKVWWASATNADGQLSANCLHSGDVDMQAANLVILESATPSFKTVFRLVLQRGGWEIL